MKVRLSRSVTLLCCLALVVPSVGLGDEMRLKSWSAPSSQPKDGLVRYVWFQLCKSKDPVSYGFADPNTRKKKVDTYDIYISYGFVDGPPKMKYDDIAKALPKRWQDSCPPQKTATSMRRIGSGTYALTSDRRDLADSVFELTHTSPTHLKDKWGKEDGDHVWFVDYGHVAVP
jgi:hypothetical protein